MIRKAFYWLVLIVIGAVWYFSDQLSKVETLSAPQAEARDGDTLVMGSRIIRLHGIDAPEYHQMCVDQSGREWPCGKAARLQLAAMVASGSLTCAVQARDKYNRDVARCSSATVPDLSESMVQAGLALSPAERGEAPYARAEAAARAAKRGVWQGNFEAPADWRANHVRGAG